MENKYLNEIVPITYLDIKYFPNLNKEMFYEINWPRKVKNFNFDIVPISFRQSLIKNFNI